MKRDVNYAHGVRRVHPGGIVKLCCVEWQHNKLLSRVGDTVFVEACGWDDVHVWDIKTGTALAWISH